MTNIRSDLAVVRQENLHEEDLADVRRDLNGFQDELASYKQKQDQINSKMTAPDVSAHEFKIISGEVQEFNNRITEVDVLRTELDHLKSRIDSLEKAPEPHLASYVDVEHFQTSSGSTLPDVGKIAFTQQSSKVSAHRHSLQEKLENSAISK